jgi:DNA invertase Pin-like site-specific DNA recombinase
MGQKVIGYIRISTDKQDLDKQRHLLLEHARANRLIIDEFVEVEVSSRKGMGERRIDELLNKLHAGDMLLVAELSRLGREMLQVLNLINDLIARGVQITFVRQPELSTTGSHGKLLLAIYGYFAEAEREFISMRVKQGLAAVKAKGFPIIHTNTLYNMTLSWLMPGSRKGYEGGKEWYLRSINSRFH